jgi:hypothetical protein
MNGQPITGLTVAALAEGTRTQVLLTSTNDRGIARFEPIAPGPHLLMLVAGECSFPLDSWSWLQSQSGARTVNVQSKGQLSRLEWKITSNAARQIQIELSGPPESCQLQIKPVAGASLPGLWVDQRWPAVKTGPLTTSWLHMGRYRAIATRGDFVSIVDFDVRSVDDVPRVVFKFQKRN